jgi:hypothetical protein
VTVETYLTDIITFLSENGIGQPNTEIFVANNDNTAGNKIYLTPYPGFDANSIKSVDENFYQPNIQILVKNSDHNIALAKATAIYKLFKNFSNRTLGTTHFLLIRPYCPPSFLYKTNAGDYQYYINCMLTFT